MNPERAMLNDPELVAPRKFIKFVAREARRGGPNLDAYSALRGWTGARRLAKKEIGALEDQRNALIRERDALKKTIGEQTNRLLEDQREIKLMESDVKRLRMMARTLSEGGVTWPKLAGMLQEEIKAFATIHWPDDFAHVERRFREMLDEFQVTIDAEFTLSKRKP